MIDLLAVLNAVRVALPTETLQDFERERYQLSAIRYQEAKTKRGRSFGLFWFLLACELLILVAKPRHSCAAALRFLTACCSCPTAFARTVAARVAVARAAAALTAAPYSESS